LAIDSAEKRRSISGIAFLPLIPGVTPNVAKDIEWRQQAAWSYSSGDVSGEQPSLDQYTVSGRTVEDLFTPATLDYPSHVTRQTN
jgi:hypothetical protein